MLVYYGKIVILEISLCECDNICFGYFGQFFPTAHDIRPFQPQNIGTGNSVGTALVFQRLYLIINELKNEAKTCERIIDQRNSELHSGLNGFDEFPVDIWLSDFYRICKILLKQNGLELSDFLGNQEAVAAEKMIADDISSVKKSVIDKISAFKKVFLD